MRRALAFVFSLGLGLTVLASSPTPDGRLAVPEARAEQSAADCVGFSKTDVDRGFEYSVSNACSRKLSCTVSWTVTCESNEGQVTSRKHEAARLALGADGNASVTASAAACKQAWSIGDVGWSCSEAK